MKPRVRRGVAPNVSASARARGPGRNGTRHPVHFSLGIGIRAEQDRFGAERSALVSGRAIRRCRRAARRARVRAPGRVSAHRARMGGGGGARHPRERRVPRPHVHGAAPSVVGYGRHHREPQSARPRARRAAPARRTPNLGQSPGPHARLRRRARDRVRSCGHGFGGAARRRARVRGRLRERRIHDSLQARGHDARSRRDQRRATHRRRVRARPVRSARERRTARHADVAAGGFVRDISSSCFPAARRCFGSGC